MKRKRERHISGTEVITATHDEFFAGKPFTILCRPHPTYSATKLQEPFPYIKRDDMPYGNDYEASIIEVARDKKSVIVASTGGFNTNVYVRLIFNQTQ